MTRILVGLMLFVIAQTAYGHQMETATNNFSLFPKNPDNYLFATNNTAGVVVPTLGAGADTYLKGKGFVGLTGMIVNVNPNYITLVGLQGRVEYGVHGHGYSVLAGGTFISGRFILPQLFVKRSFYTEHDTKEKGDSISVGTMVDRFGVWIGQQQGILHGASREGLYAALEVSL